MKRSNPAGVRAYPSHGVGARFDACTDIELQHDGRFRTLRENFHGTNPAVGSELRLMVVIPWLQTGRLKLFSCKVQGIRDSFPAIQSRFLMRTSHHDVL